MRAVSTEYYPLLKEVSRSFYLTLRVLPGKIRWPIGLAYLLARATDTIADTELVPLEERLAALRSLRERIAQDLAPPLELHRLVPHQGTPGEGRLLGQIEALLAELRRLPVPDKERVREVLQTITTGQESDLTRFQGASAARIVALQSEADLDQYTYQVAGCVGIFWTKMCRAHLFPAANLDDATLLNDGVRFGKGLQLTNILRDVPADLRRGRCYFPSNQLAQNGLSPVDLLQSANESRFRPVYNSWVSCAREHLTAGWVYTNALPYSCVRLRLACAWPILIGIKTLEKLQTQPVLDDRHPIKVTRAQVRAVMAKSLLCYPSPKAWKRLFPI